MYADTNTILEASTLEVFTLEAFKHYKGQEQGRS